MRLSKAMSVLAAGIGLIAVPAHAQTQVGDAQMVSVSGKCDRLEVGDRSFSDACGTKLLNVVYPNGRVGFYFVLEDGRVFAFSGMDGDNPTPDTDVVHLDKLIMTSTGTPDKPDVLAITGTCTFGNPMKGPMTVACTGTLAQGGSVDAAFTTDGQPPA